MRIAWGRSLFYFLILAGVGAGISHFTDAQRSSDGTVTKAGTQTFDQLHIGDCIEKTSSDGPSPAPSSEGDSSFNVVPCSQPHIWEVFGQTAVTDSEFNDLTLQDESSSFCSNEFTTYVGVTPSYSSLRFEWYQPTQETWHSGDRLITCLAATSDKQMTTGSFKNYNG